MAKKNFEDALTHLEKIVEELENTDLSLDNALKKFEDGMELVRFCTKTLAETQSKIDALNNDGNANNMTSSGERPKCYKPVSGI